MLLSCHSWTPFVIKIIREIQLRNNDFFVLIYGFIIYREFYNDKLIQNYYDPERIEKRDHPLNAQRIIYLYEMLNILIVDEKVQLLPIREGIINKLKIVKNISENRDSNVKNYNVINDSIRQLKQSLINIRKKIPRLTD